MPVTIDLAVAKTHKYATRESGDTAEVVERPGGGVSIVVADAQGSGSAAKLLSLQVVGRTVSLLNDGVRDGAAARATHDFLYAMRSGRVSATLDIVSVDLASRTVLFTRNSEVPMLLWREGDLQVVTESGGRIGIYRHTRPRVLEFPVASGLAAVLMTDGVAGAGERWGCPLDLLAIGETTLRAGMTAEETADEILRAALEADRGRPSDDMTVVALRLGPATRVQPIRRVRVTIPLAEA